MQNSDGSDLSDVSCLCLFKCNLIYDICIDILQHRVTMPSLNISSWKFSTFVVFVFVFVFLCVFFIIDMCQEAVSIINFPQIYNRLGF